MSWVTRTRAFLCVDTDPESIWLSHLGNHVLIHEVGIKYTLPRPSCSGLETTLLQTLTHTEMELGVRPEGREDRRPLLHCGSHLPAPLGLDMGLTVRASPQTLGGQCLVFTHCNSQQPREV